MFFHGNKRLKRTVITLLIIVAGLFLCNFLYLMLDYGFNGFVREWFGREYVYMEWVPIEEVADGYYHMTIQWSKLKEMVFKVSLQMAQIKAAMQRQEQLQKEEASRKNDLITYLAHDLKTPLTSVVGYLSLLDEAYDMPREQKAKYIHITLDKAQRLEKLINEFFEITRYNLQQIVLEKEIVDLHFMLIQMTDEFYPILTAHGNTIRLDLYSRQEGRERKGPDDSEENVTVYADSEKLARVFNNILKNAIAYSYPNTEILVRCINAGEKVYVTFSNRGKTIPAQKLDAVFEKFFRLDDARSTNSGGAGLGLAIAKDIITLHGGTITADSTEEATTFTVEIPIYHTEST